VSTVASGTPPGPGLPGFLNSLAGPLDHYGYGAIALLLLLENIGVPVIPGELGMIAGAIFAGTGRAGLNVVLVGVVAVTAAIAGAEIGYLIGRFAGRELILHYGKYAFIKDHHLDRAEAIVDRFGGIVVVIARYIVGLREANGLIAGITQMRWLTFTFFNVLGGCAWVATWVSVGYLAGDHIASIYRNVNRFAIYALIALAVVLAGYIVRRVLRRRRATQTHDDSETPVAEESPTAESPLSQENSEATETSLVEEDSAPPETIVAQEASEVSDESVSPNGSNGSVSRELPDTQERP
jgi:membrane protein DedA with SNARE-associated domain